MLRRHETPAFLTAKGFCALCDCVKHLSRPPTVSLPEKMATARLGAIRSAVEIAEDLEPDRDALTAALAAPSVEIISALFDGPRKAAWHVLLADLMQRWEDGEGGICYTINTSDNFSVEHLLYLEGLGLPLAKMTSTFGRRMITDPDPSIDAFVRRLTLAGHGETEPILHAGHWSTSALRLMHPRHFVRLEQLLTSEAADRTHAALEFMCERFHLPRDWHQIALMLRIGFRPEDCLDHAPAEVIALAEKTRSAHGRMDLVALEPDLMAMAGRDEDASFLGLTRKDIKALLA